ncbi:MAG TPA: dTMP kinase [Anaerolineaceae bacterium]|nr:dTMP kinase [Anaerolineaceae bacterium]
MFITLEGPEGSGKTSQLPALAEFLRGKGYDVLVTREPGGTSVGDQIREVLMNMKNVSIVPQTEILLFQAARAQHVAEILRPALDEGKIVICDRFGDSTLAYQGYGHQTDIGTLQYLIHFATGGLTPDLTLLLDIPVNQGFERKLKNDSEWNRLDAYAKAFHERVRQGYLELAREEPERWRIIDASAEKDRVQEEMRKFVLQKIAG